MVKQWYYQNAQYAKVKSKNEADRTSHSTYYLPKVEIKNYNVMIVGKNLFDQPINSHLKTHENIRKIATG